MFPELSKIKNKRKKLGLTQNQLSKKTGISQSMIAKIEKKNAIPSYKIAKKIFAVLKKMELKKEVKAKQIMTLKIISVSPETRIKKVISLFSKYDISQCPVINNHTIVGSINEKTIINNIEISKQSPVSKIMNEPFPIMTPDTPISILSTIIKEYDGILIMSRGKLKGIITKSNILKAV